jgi:DNA-binding transcriptional regulator GbsR (MarR family)
MATMEQNRPLVVDLMALQLSYGATLALLMLLESPEPMTMGELAKITGRTRQCVWVWLKELSRRELIAVTRRAKHGLTYWAPVPQLRVAA